MVTSERLQVRVSDELMLNAGTCEAIAGPNGPERIIRPPANTLFHQVLGYLREKSDPPKRPSGSMVGREGVAAAALAIRWGSYLAVLLDHDKSVWSEVESPSTSRISDEEMARINIEASAALADWIDVLRSDQGWCTYEQLVNRAVAYLPMPKKTSKLKVTEFGALSGLSARPAADDAGRGARTHGLRERAAGARDVRVSPLFAGAASAPGRSRC